jgi:hypothetical protein
VLPPVGDVDTARLGFFIVTAASPAEARSRLAALTDQLTVTVRTAPAAA